MCLSHFGFFQVSAVGFRALFFGENGDRACPWTHLDHRQQACVKPCDETYWKCLITVLGKKLSYKMIP